MAEPEWQALLGHLLRLDEVYAKAKDVAAAALIDNSITVANQSLIWGSCVDQILQRPLPLDRSNKHKPTVMLELLDPADRDTGIAPLFERVWSKLSPLLTSTAQRTSMLLLTGVSGAGKTKVAFDIGRAYAFVVIARVWEQGVATPPWQLLKDVTQRLRVQSQRRGGPSTESRSAVAALLFLLSCHFEWAAAVYTAAKDASQSACCDERVLREVSLRAQRNGMGHRAV
jgi:hypothetical protein